MSTRTLSTTAELLMILNKNIKATKIIKTLKVKMYGHIPSDRILNDDQEQSE